MSVIAGRFELGALAGRGAVGEVYRATDRSTGRLVALKLLRRDAGDERFDREVRALRELDHPHIVQYVAHGAVADGRSFLACEWVEGETLHARLARGPLDLRGAMALGHAIADALATAHARGFIHRDLKPRNLLLAGGDPAAVKLLDFGLVLRPRVDPTLTEIGAIVGTPAYMAPEQARGLREVGPPADVFATGCVLFHAIAGRVPFVADDTLGILLKIVLEPAPRLGSLAQVPPALDDVVARMLEKDPAHRYVDGEALARALAEVDAPSSSAVTAVRRADQTARLGLSERRIASLVLVRRVGGGQAVAPEPAVLAELEAISQHFHGRVELLADGSVGIPLEGGGSLAPTDRAALAARCALAIEPLVQPAAIAVVSGQVAAHRDAPVGQLVDAAVALLTNAGPRTIYLDDATAGLLAREHAVVQDGDDRLLRSAREADASTLLGRPTPFVGRERDLSLLEVTFEECVEERVARSVLVTAEAGVGKTRLARELVDRIRSRRPVAVLRARGEPIGASPLSLVAQLVRDAVGIGETDLLARRRERIRAHLSRRIADVDLERVVSFIGEAIGAPFEDEGRVDLAIARRDPAVMRDQIRRAWEDFLLAECARWPVVLVLEDLQWGDFASVKLVDAALRNLRDARLFVLALARPDVEQRFPGLWAERQLQWMRLRPLTRAASLELARAALAAASEKIAARVADLSDGNAFYLEELVRAVSAGSDELPPTVVAMAQARLGGFDDQARRVLRAASVFGAEFSAAGVAALLGGAPPEPVVERCLEELREREVVVRRRSDVGDAGGVRYGWRHALLREAAYAALTDEDRELGHRLAARWLEGAAEVWPLELAEHFERGGQPDRAIAWYRRAAEQALDGNDLESAVAWAERGVRCGAADEVLGALRLVQAEARVWSGTTEELDAAARAAVELLPRASPLWFRAVGCFVVSGSRLGLPSRTVDAARAVVAAAEAAPVCREAVTALARVTVGLCYDSGLYADAAAVVEAASRLASLLPGDPYVAGWLARARASIALCTGDAGAFLDRAEEAASFFTAAGDVRIACVQRSLAGFGWLEVGAPARAEAVLREALEVGSRLGASTVETAAKQNLGLALARQGRFDEAIDVEREAVATCVAARDRRMEPGCRTYLAIALTAAGRHDEAAEEARTAAAIARDAAPMLAFSLATHARIELARGDTVSAVSLATKAAALLDELGTIEEGEATVRLAHAEALLATGDVAGARAVIATAAVRLQSRADRIASAMTRRSFLEDVPDNARTLALYSELVA